MPRKAAKCYFEQLLDLKTHLIGILVSYKVFIV